MRNIYKSLTFKYIACALAALFALAGLTQLYSTNSNDLNSGTVITSTVKFGGASAEKATVRVQTRTGEVSGTAPIKSVPQPGQSVLLTKEAKEWHVTGGYPVKFWYPYSHGLPLLLSIAATLTAAIAIMRRVALALDRDELEEQPEERTEASPSEIQKS